MRKKTGISPTVVIAVRVPQEIREALTKIAENDTRSVASLIHKLLKEYIASKASK